MKRALAKCLYFAEREEKEQKTINFDGLLNEFRCDIYDSEHHSKKLIEILAKKRVISCKNPSKITFFSSKIIEMLTFSSN